MDITTWFNDFFLNYWDQTYAIFVLLLAGGGFYLYRTLYTEQQANYESIDQNEVLKSQMEAARRKQQQNYDKFIKENESELVKAYEEEMARLQRLRSRSRQGKDPKDDEKLFTDNDYFPLMGDGSSGSSYRPPKKRACGPCGGGGCG